MNRQAVGQLVRSGKRRIEYSPKPASCAGCPWEHRSKGFAHATGSPLSKVWVIAESAGENEAIEGKPLVGWSGIQLNRDLKPTGFAREDLYIDNVIPCQPPAGYKKKNKIPKEVIDFCTTRHILPKLSANKPDLILAIGEYSLNLLTGRKGIMKQRGSLLQAKPEISQAYVVPTVHWAATAWQQKYKVLRPFIGFDVEKAISIGFDKVLLSKHLANAREDFLISPTLPQIREAFASIAMHGRVAIDIEHGGGSYQDALMLCIGYYWGPKGSERGICVPFFGLRASYVWSNDEFAEIIKLTADLLANPDIEKVLQNGNSDLQVLEISGFKVANFKDDTIIKHKDVFNERGVPHTLGFIGSVHSDVPFSKDDAKGQASFALVDPKILHTYNLKDCKITWDGDLDLDGYIDEAGLRNIYEFDMQLNHVVRRMMQRGIWMDERERQIYRRELQQEIREIDEDIRKICGSSFKPTSGVHMRMLLYDILGFIPPATTQHGAPKLDFDTFISLQESLAADDSIRRLLDLFMLRSKQAKIESTYLRKMYPDKNGFIHTTYKLHVVPSGRLSSTDPNLMNLPRQKEEGKRVKRIFRARPGFVFVARDYSQIELAIYGYAAQDQALIDEIDKPDSDLHTLSARDLFARQTITPLERDFTKIFHYGGILYGGGPDAIRTQAVRQLLRARDMHSVVPSKERIEELQNNWFQKHPAAAAFNAYIDQQVETNRRVKTLISGRPRICLLPVADSKRAGRSHVISGTAADLINPAMVELDRRLRDDDGLALQVHDECLLEVRKDHLREALEISKEIMEKPAIIGGRSFVPRTAASYGECLGEMEKFKES